MTTQPHENLLDWLRDAHAMEQQAEQMLKGQISRIEHYPQVKARLEQHLQETLGQQQLLEGAIRRLGGSPSTMKDLMGKVTAFGQAVGGMMAPDEIVKGSIAGYIFEQMEIANYTALLAAAEQVGDHDTVQIVRQILPQEQAMAQWLQDHLPGLVQEFLTRDATEGVPAKR